MQSSGQNTDGSAAARQSSTFVKFWPWLFVGHQSDGGWRRVLNRWCVLHTTVGVILAWIVPVTLREAASAVLLPLTGVLVGVTFAWAGNAIALMQSREIQQLASKVPGGVATYVYTFQLAILAIIVTMSAWGVAGLGVFDRPCVFACPVWGYKVVMAALFAMASLTLRECWHVVLGVQSLLLAQFRMQQSLRLPPG